MNRSVRSLVDRILPRIWWKLQKRRIRRRGWASVELSDEAQKVFWAYTVGFEATLSHPEIVVANQDHRTVEQLLLLIYRGIGKGELIIRDGDRWDVCGLPRMVWRQVHESRITTDWFTRAMRHRWERGLDPNGLQVFQLVLPDFGGRLPWEAGYLEEQRAYTAELWRPA